MSDIQLPSKVYLQLENGRYMNDYYSQPLVTSERVKWWTTTRIAGCKYAFKSHSHSRYLCAANQGNITANRENRKDYEEFTIEDQGNGYYKVKCDRDNKYIYFNGNVFKHDKKGGGDQFKISDDVDKGPLGKEKVFFELPDGRYMGDYYSGTLTFSPDAQPKWYYAVFYRNNTYAFESVGHNRFLCAAKQGNITCNREVRDINELFIVETQGDDTYKVKCNRDSKYIYLDGTKFRHNKEGGGIKFRISDDKDDDDDDEKKIEKTEIMGIDFDLDAASIFEPDRVELSEFLFENKTDLEKLSSSEQLEYTKNMESSFSNAAGGGIEVGTEFKSGFPCIAEGKISVTVSANYEHTWGETELFAETMILTVPSNPIQPHSSFKAKVVALKTTMSVPCTIKIKRGNHTESIKSTWDGVSTWNVALEYSNPLGQKSQITMQMSD
eukprot:109359_1